MLLPSFTDASKDKSPEDVISAVNQSLSNIPLAPKFMWLDTYFISNPDSKANIDYITRLRSAADKVNIRVDILTSIEVWKQHMENTDVFKNQGVLDWDDQAIVEVLTEKYGGWNAASVYSTKPHLETCSIYHAE
ncbi:unnamed protein product [Auanema sp. JU1783]|nr:unnamed protein product [Auanema sp. JU1783]